MIGEASKICQEAAKLVDGERSRTHGEKQASHDRIAEYWSVYLQAPVSAKDVSSLMELLKMARQQVGAYNRDDYVDRAGYAGVTGELAALEVKHANSASQKRIDETVLTMIKREWAALYPLKPRHSVSHTLVYTEWRDSYEAKRKEMGGTQ